MTCARAGQAQTVLGAIAGEAMGITLPHEHLLIDFKVMFAEPEAASDKGRAWEPVALANLGWVRQHFNANLDNLRLTDEEVAIDEIRLFQQAGGATVVDPTPRTLARDPLALARIARATGLHVVMGTTYPWTENERKVLRAAIAAQRETGAPLMIHPGRHPGMPMELAEFVRKEGGDVARTIMCHIDRTIADVRAVIDLARTGIWLEYDLFGLENSYYPSFDMPNDGGRMRHILALLEAGHGDRLLLSHDIAYKTSLVMYGGYGYHHLLVNVVPRLRRKGVDDAGLRQLLVDNPRRAFQFA